MSSTSHGLPYTSVVNVIRAPVLTSLSTVCRVMPLAQEERARRQAAAAPEQAVHVLTHADSVTDAAVARYASARDCGQPRRGRPTLKRHRSDTPVTVPVSVQ